MKTIWVIAKREINRYYGTPAAYAIAFMMLLILGGLFFASAAGALLNGVALQPMGVLNVLNTLLLFATPAVTMHLISEEQRMGTIELMMTAPVKDWHLVVGKWLGGLMFMLTIIVFTFIFPIISDLLVEPGVDVGPLLTGYLGLILVSSTFIAIGVAVSTFFESQIASFFLTLGILLLLWIMSAFGQGAVGGNELLEYLSLSRHANQNFFAGVIDLRDIVYFLSMTSLALFIGSVNIETKRWR